MRDFCLMFDTKVIALDEDEMYFFFHLSLRLAPIKYVNLVINWLDKDCFVCFDGLIRHTTWIRQKDGFLSNLLSKLEKAHSQYERKQSVSSYLAHYLHIIAQLALYWFLFFIQCRSIAHRSQNILPLLCLISVFGQCCLLIVPPTSTLDLLAHI